jgi:polyhydroxyalkanoate synthase
VAASVEAFRVKVGGTPSRVVWREGASVLRRYGGGGGTPLLLVYSMVNKPFILDLLPGLSVVERLSQQRPVYLLDWGAPLPEDAERGLEYYVAGRLGRAVDAVRKGAKGRPIHLAGYCQGGVFSLLYAAVQPEKVRTLTLLATPVDTRRLGTLRVWSAKRNLDAERLAKTFGNIPGSFLHSAFEILKPYGSLRSETGFLAGLWSRKLSEGREDHFLALERWKKDVVAHPGRAFAEIVGMLFQEDRLVKNSVALGGRRVDLKRVTCPLFVAVGERDHLVPPDAALPVTGLVSSRDARVQRVPVGHIGLSVSGTAHKELWPKYTEWLERRD